MKIYFISICGKGVGNLAVLLKKMGHDVRGSEFSESTFYPPIADLIKDNEIPVDFGFDPEKITTEYDLIITGGAALIHDPNNPQLQRAKDLNLKLITFAKGIGEFVSKEEQIEVVGNHGKTTTTSIVAWCLKKCGEDASYFIGEAPMGFDESIHSGESKWSVAEGDEHPSLGQEPGGKFLYHKPKHVLFTSADWDHKNIYPTEESYFQVYRELFDIIPQEGQINAALDGVKVLDVLETSKLNDNLILYTIGRFKDIGFNATAEDIEDQLKNRLEKVKKSYPKVYEKLNKVYYLASVDYRWKPDATRFNVRVFDVKANESANLGHFETQLLGQIGIENSLGAISTLHSLGFDYHCLSEGISSFPGLRRRLELIYNKDYKVINDFAHSPIKIESTLKAIRIKYPDNKIFVIFHINQSGLKEKTTFQQLKSSFNLADFVLIPRVLPDPKQTEQFFGKDYRDLIKEGASDAEYLKPTNVYYTPLGVQLQSVLENNLSPNDVIVIMSSGDASEFISIAKSLRLQNSLYND